MGLPHARGVRLALLALFNFFAGCANLQLAQQADFSFDAAHLFGVTAVAFSPDNKLLASGGYRGEIKLWQLDPPRLLETLIAHSDSVRALAFHSPDSLFSGADDGRLVAWDLSRSANTMRLLPSPITSLDVYENLVTTGHADGYLRRYHVSNLAPEKTVLAGASVVALARHGATLAAASDTGITFLDSNLSPVRQLDSYGTQPRDLRFSPDGKLLAAGDWFQFATWDVASGTMQSFSAEHNGLITSLDFNPQGTQLVTLGRHTDSAIRLWNTDTLSLARRYAAHELCGAMIRFSPDGQLMASASDDESIRLYDVRRSYQPQ